ncbi:hypothetical protein [Campylobacter troglodytis]|uniref:hypothetical protein n=1 Tax=Campylobacter troglodytis TaxID=654363 RepID=UPI0011588630|nr:hypothetical protein [Campylobacter troglodytis]
MLCSKYPLRHFAMQNTHPTQRVASLAKQNPLRKIGGFKRRTFRTTEGTLLCLQNKALLKFKTQFKRLKFKFLIFKT